MTGGNRKWGQEQRSVGGRVNGRRKGGKNKKGK